MYYSSFLGVKCLYHANRPKWRDIMNPDKMRRLEACGWKVGNAEEFLGLTDEEKEVVDSSYKVKVTNKIAPILVPYLKYKNYYGVIEIDVEKNILFGRVVGIEDVITFQALTVEQAKIEFAKSVEDYLEFCKG